MIAGLPGEIERLKRRVGMDSSNSSMPPGSDGPGARAKRAKRKKALAASAGWADRPRGPRVGAGGQPGSHRGAGAARLCRLRRNAFGPTGAGSLHGSTSAVDRCQLKARRRRLCPGRGWTTGRPGARARPPGSATHPAITPIVTA
ncbi:DUF6444 domain-containing protein [Allorhizocola rhizosphaerae]|uniref:DUF6444 domain-containing protein n=1 Tax=Allorhizocola rhizosphaerae TaxID=1872709 RepID=UPI003CCC52DD